MRMRIFGAVILLGLLSISRAEPVIAEPAEFAATILATGAEWRQLGGGYAGCEGAQWIVENGVLTLHYAAQHDYLAFKWTEAGGRQTWRNDSPEATSFRPDGYGVYYVVEQTNRRLTRWDANGQMVEVLADRFEGQRLNRPNDVVVKRDGTLWFTDPDFLFNKRPQDVKELAGQYVYRFDPKTKQLTAVIRDLVLPNGIAFSPDEHWLYVTDSATTKLDRWPVREDGTLGERTLFADLPEKGLDGLTFDSSGRLWCAARLGVHVFTEDGQALGVIKTPNKPTSIAFAPAPSRLVCITVRDAAWITQLGFNGPP